MAGSFSSALGVRGFVRLACLMVAATVGAGIFTLPYATRESGWGFAVAALILVSFIMAFAHSLLWDVVEESKERSDLTGLAGRFLGTSGKLFSFAVVLGGLILTLVVYLILGGAFIGTLVPSLGTWGVVIFWAVSSLPVLLRTENFAKSEFIGVGILAAIVGLLFMTGIFRGSWPAVPAMRPSGIFLLMSASLFAFGGWTGVGSLVRFSKAERIPRAASKRGIAWGTATIALLYAVFVYSVFLLSDVVSPEAVSGISRGPWWVPIALVAIGLVGMRNAYAPISLEIQNALQKDAHFSRRVSLGITLLLPLLLFFLGLRNITEVIGLVGGVFVGLQYVLIVSVGRAALRLSPLRALCASLLLVLFVLTAVYEVYSFILH